MKRLARLAIGLRRTLLRAAPTVAGILIVNFLLLQLLPGDAAEVIAGESGSATADTMAMLRARFGLDQPVLMQLAEYLNNLAHFSLGYSPRYSMPVSDLILARLPNTLLLMLSAVTLALSFGIVLGSIMAQWADRWPDRVLSVVTLVLYSMPGFWVGLMAIVLFSVTLGWLPAGGDATIGAGLTGARYALDRLQHMALPTIALGSFYVAIYARLTRASVLEILQQDFVRTAVSKGLHPFPVFVRHVLQNSLIPITTVAGLHFGAMLGGAIVVETVFGWPGLGRLALEAMMARDFRVLLGVLLLSSLLVVFVNAAVDALQAWLDPRIAAR